MPVAPSFIDPTHVFISPGLATPKVQNLGKLREPQTDQPLPGEKPKTGPGTSRRWVHRS
ncbi:hypothetical protein MPNT_10371 [Candidatus Methylacidithermus pantelleriae]|uniref:Uncharacterized protein n=1 Tax=Candidatus Methylacidithermus pantelleriae TaxID=2744239 RepID=A0A8J2BG56_9BACT|nr:hypothetical protein MPNT_10371 [Candidatus Methylacidithermus pantelleriae]